MDNVKEISKIKIINENQQSETCDIKDAELREMISILIGEKPNKDENK